jgi:hypothetical protein
MSLETTLNSKVKPVVGHEVVLFRTRSEILTDQRIIIRGNTYPLRVIAKIQVQPAWYYAPFLLTRLLLVPVAILPILNFLNVVGSDVVPGNPNVNMFMGVVLSLLLAFATWIVPTYDLRMQAATGESEIIMRGHDPEYLREVKAKIENAIGAQQVLVR